MVVDQSNGNKNIDQPHRIDDVSANDIWFVDIIYFSRWSE